VKFTAELMAICDQSKAGMTQKEQNLEIEKHSN